MKSGNFITILLISVLFLISCKKETSEENKAGATNTTATLIKSSSGESSVYKFSARTSISSGNLPCTISGVHSDYVKGSNLTIKIKEFKTGTYTIGNNASLHFTSTEIFNKVDFEANEGTISVSSVSNGKVRGTFSVKYVNELLLTSTDVYELKGDFSAGS